MTKANRISDNHYSAGQRRNGGGNTPPFPSAQATRQMLAESVPPQHLEAERAVLGSIMRDNHCMADVARRLKSEHFYSDAHQKIFSCMLSMFEQAQPIDAITLGDELFKRKVGTQSWLAAVGGSATLIRLYDETLTAANVNHYAAIVYDKAVLRSLIHTSTEVLQAAYEASKPSEELLQDAEKSIFAILQGKSTGDAVEVGDILGKVFDRLSARQSGQIGGGVPTGFHDLDEMTNGWQNSEMIVLAARPSMGKTACVLNMMEAAAVDHQIPTLFCSLEMAGLEIAERLLCARSRVNNHLLRKGRVDKEQMDRLIQAGGELSASPLFIDDTPGQTILRIAATARRIKLRYGLGLIAIDYLQLIEPDDRSVPRQEQIGNISRRIKTLARELNVPIIALSQLNRAVETREGHRPRTADLRESGSIEQDADVIVMLHRDDFYDPENEEKRGQAILIVAKQRNGPTGDVKLTFQRDIARFSNYAPEITAFADTGDDF